MVGPHVEIDAGVVLHSHVAVMGQTHLGQGCQVFPFASIGHIPQDMKYRGEESSLIVGDHTTIREHVTINPGTKGGGLVTRVGSHCLLMVGSHVAHDCQLGNHVVLGNNATLAGHVTIGEYAVLGALSAVHQFVRIGAYALIGEMAGIPSDVFPFAMANGTGREARLSGLNMVGLKRHGFSSDQLRELCQAFRALLSNDGTLNERLEGLTGRFTVNPLVKQIIEFINCGSDRSFLRPNASVSRGIESAANDKGHELRWFVPDNPEATEADAR
jgi:UDP-N-acetylglucosamine acyltransferase